MTDRRDMEAVIEAILFVSNDAVSRGKLLEVFDEGEREMAAEAIEAVIERYREDSSRGVMIDEAAGGLRLVSRPDLHSYLRRFFEVTGSNKLTMPGLESLAIIAYRQPVTAPEIQELRGVNSSGVLKKLLERRLIRISGRKEVVGKPFLYATTREFLQHFGLRSLKELPPLEQFEELFGGDVAGPDEAGPDPEEHAAREVAELEARDDEAFDKAEAEAIEAERAAAEEAEELAAITDAGPSEAGEATVADDEAVAEEASSDDSASAESAAVELPADDAEDGPQDVEAENAKQLAEVEA
ncbi:MAG: SMC-Scp complex subunit ScpB [Acidobacteriota bacterium]